MATEAPVYDLTLLLSLGAEEERRAKILSDVESAISRAGGSVERNDDWGWRPMAYEIRHQPEAEYHLLQFKAPGSLIEELSHTLRITDGVLRFRVIKVRPGTPPPPSSPPPVVVAVASASGGSSTSGERAVPAAERSAPAAEESASGAADAPASVEHAPSGAEQAAPGAEDGSPDVTDS